SDAVGVAGWCCGVNAASCGASGALVAMTWIVHPYLGLAYTVRSFMIVIIAGLGNVAAVLAAALGLGVAENFAGFILGAEYQAAFVFALLVAILVWRRFWLARERRYLQWSRLPRLAGGCCWLVASCSRCSSRRLPRPTAARLPASGLW